jgi:hypothetical protein
VDGSAMMGFPPRLRPAPRMKSTWPPMPEKNRPSNVSAATCPVRSTPRAALMATMRSLRAMITGSLVNLLPRISTAGLSCTQS